MSAKDIFSLFAILLGCALIIGGFIIFGESLELKVQILDIIVSCLIFTIFVVFFFFPVVKLNNPAHKEVGMLGIRLTTLNLCSLLSIGLIFFGIVCDIPFKYQLMGQFVIVFLFLLGCIATLHSGEKVQRIYEKEQKTVEGKKTLRYVMDDFMDDVSASQQMEESAVGRLRAIQESIRYITPSLNAEAKNFDYMFVQSIEDLKVLMRNSTLNKDKISEKIDHLERILARRKKY